MFGEVVGGDRERLGQLRLRPSRGGREDVTFLAMRTVPLLGVSDCPFWRRGSLAFPSPQSLRVPFPCPGLGWGCMCGDKGVNQAGSRCCI